VWVFSLDLETTGLDTSLDRTVQIGISAMHSDGESVGWSSLVNPQGHPISPSASAVNGLTDDDVSKAPAFGRVWIDVLRFVFERSQNSGHGQSELPHVLTWNGWGFDWPLLFAEFARYGISKPLWRFLDLRTYASAPKNLNAVCERYGVVLDRAANHDAGRDAQAVLDVYGKMRKRGHCPDVATIARAQGILMVGR
jgi:DNA polymerase-3 subunit epsilon